MAGIEASGAVRVRAIGALRPYLGPRGETLVPWAQGMTVLDAYRAAGLPLEPPSGTVATKDPPGGHPVRAAVPPGWVVPVRNGDTTGWQDTLSPGDALLFTPPVSGGRDELPSPPQTATPG